MRRRVHAVMTPTSDVTPPSETTRSAHVAERSTARGPSSRSSRSELPDARRLLSQFNIAFSLMSIIPLLICCYLVTVKFFSLSALQGLNGVYFLFAVVFAVLGLVLGYTVTQEILRRLVEANAQLDRLYRIQANFVSNVAHELRTPLAIIKGALDNLGDGLHGALTSDQLEPVGMSQREVNRLRRLVGDLLDLAQMESGKLQLRQEDVGLQDLLTTVAKLFHGPFKERGLSVSVDLPEAPARVVGDRDRLQQVLINLLTNAMKFTQQGEIRVRLSREDQMFRIDVEDTGPGIAREDLERIFDKFERVGDREAEGSGLGLAIARDIVQLHHGRLWAESELGRGSRFIIQLPAGS